MADITALSVAAAPIYYPQRSLNGGATPVAEAGQTTPAGGDVAAQIRQDARSKAAAGDNGQKSGGSGGNPLNLSDEEKQKVQELRKRDREVKRHEQAHQAAGGPYAGGASYEYVRGPDGAFYAVSGEVSIDASPEKDPRATIAKMEVIIRAATAPADPSAQDRAVAAQARAEIAKARQELQKEKLEEAQGDGTSGGPPAPTQLSKAASAYGRSGQANGLFNDPAQQVLSLIA